MNKIKKYNINYKNLKNIEDNKENNNTNYNNINPYLIENKILDYINENEDIEINRKKNKNIIYRQNFKNFDDINKKKKNEQYDMIYSNNNDEEIKDNSEENNCNSKNDDYNDNNYENKVSENNFKSFFKKSNNNKKFMTKILNLNNNINDVQKNQYEEEIARLKQEISNLENDNDILSTQLIEEERKNEELHQLKNEKEESDNSILSDISHCLQVSSFEEILPKLTEMINYLTNYNNDKKSKMKEDIISKLKSLYIITNDSKEKKDNISIQDLWRWIKQLIEEVNELSLEKEKYEEMYNKNSNDVYKNFCEKLIKEFGLNSFDELKFFINDLMTKNDLNKKRVEKLRKVLMNNNNDSDNKEESFNINNINNNNNYYMKEDNDYDNDYMNNNIIINNNNYNYMKYTGNSGNKKLRQNYFYNNEQY